MKNEKIYGKFKITRQKKDETRTLLLNLRRFCKISQKCCLQQFNSKK